MRRGNLVASLALAAGICASCGGDSVWPVGLGVQEWGAVELAGYWVGQQRITTKEHQTASRLLADRNQPGFSFPVALQLFEAPDMRFRLFAFGYPPDGVAVARICEGVYATRDRRLQFFPATKCPALPLNTFTIGRTGGSLRLEAATDPTGLRQPGGELGTIRVIMDFSRADRVPGRGDWNEEEAALQE